MKIPPHRVLLITGGKWHDYATCAAVMTDALKPIGTDVTHTEDASAVTSLVGGKFDCVLLYTCDDKFNESQVESLARFVRGGGGLVGIHSANVQKSSDPYAKLIGSTFQTHGPVLDFKVSVSDPNHSIAHRVQDFRVTDELYVSELKAEVQPFLTAYWGGKPQPLGYSRAEGKGRVVYLANGHSPEVMRHPTFQQLLQRCVRYATGEDWSNRTVKVAAIGYGGAFNMGKTHLQSCEKARMKATAVCDVDPKRAATAKEELGEHVQTFTKVDDLLKGSDTELCIVITPHNTHAALSIQCLEAGRHVVTEKPFTITVDQATRVIETARRANRMATVFHNRRWDGDFMTIRRLIESGAIGNVFHIECSFGGFNEPKVDWWRSYKDVSGGAFYDWGAHFVDWVLQLMPHKIESIAGDFKKLKWHQVSNEDYTSAYVRFAGGRSASIEQGSINAIGKSKWRILGTDGGIEMRRNPATDKDEIRVVSTKGGQRTDTTVPILTSDWDGFYRNVADHLLLGEPLAVTPESARKVIAVLSLSEQSSKQGGAPVVPPFEQ
jgi:scyllo-inositol 2-dehydrogenase (NADP+)